MENFNTSIGKMILKYKTFAYFNYQNDQDIQSVTENIGIILLIIAIA